jgi:Methionyl-tRNA synthetase
MKFYLSTAIAYASGKPHFGNSYEIVMADAIARHKRRMGYDVCFCTGTDEHGQKVETLAKAADISPQEYVDNTSAEIKRIWDLLDTTYTRFIRTTEDYHEKQVQKIFEKLYEQGDIYKSQYDGMYCTPCESFFTSSQLVDGNCPDCGRPVQTAQEDAYFLRLSNYTDWLLKHIEESPNFITPESRKNEMVESFIKGGLSDLCVSRSSFKWGIPVTFDPDHIIYVWIDALSNYITALGFDLENPSEDYQKYWPADVHIIGKDILRFHTIYWPITLKMLGVPVPKAIFGHPWFLFGEDKMSKSKGNIIYADTLVDIFGVDAVRWYMLSQMPYSSDGSITYDKFLTVFNADLANTIGNLVTRTVSMRAKYFESDLPEGQPDPLDSEVLKFATEMSQKALSLLDAYRVADAADAALDIARRLNKYIDETTPWTLAKSSETLPRLSSVIETLYSGIETLANTLTPFMPSTVDKIKEQLKSGNAEVLFPRITEKEFQEKLEA